ncbi:MAG: hypothetical protein KGI38_02375 [Thaumarchaeota archaeon]|nr:hypothetical protein [Nitrososphaerota archaeon]
MSESQADKDTREQVQRLHEQAILVVGFLGAAAFAGLVLILGNPTFILNSTSEGGETYLQAVAFMLVFVSGLSGITVAVSFLAMSTRMTVEGAKRVYRMTFNLIIIVFVGFEVCLTFIFNAVNIDLALVSNTILVIVAFLTTRVVLSARDTS